MILIGTILSAHVFAWLTPGPIIALIIRNSLVYSRKTGIWTAVGIALAAATHITYSVTGLTLIITSSPTAFNIIKFLCVSYLTYLGIKTIFIKVETKKNNKAVDKRKDISSFNAVKTGFITNIFNPAASLFLGSVFALLIGSGYPIWVIVFLWLVLPLNSFLMGSLLSLFFTHELIKNIYTDYQHIINRFLGLILIIFAIMVAVQK